MTSLKHTKHTHLIVEHEIFKFPRTHPPRPHTASEVMKRVLTPKRRIFSRGENEGKSTYYSPAREK